MELLNLLQSLLKDCNSNKTLKQLFKYFMAAYLDYETVKLFENFILKKVEHVTKTD